jgi:hypothetical protein
MALSRLHGICLGSHWPALCEDGNWKVLAEEQFTTHIRFDPFPASEYNEVFSGYQPVEVVQLYQTEPPYSADSPRKIENFIKFTTQPTNQSVRHCFFHLVFTFFECEGHS